MLRKRFEILPMSEDVLVLLYLYFQITSSFFLLSAHSEPCCLLDLILRIYVHNKGTDQLCSLMSAISSLLIYSTIPTTTNDLVSF